ncbi:catalase family peroxidase [Thauera sp. 2A1]|uniref:catalase family peroxidase n=1 Tax=Thauera sp. 2A1 TaxID=2570191 RepID=UPI00210E902B|nr:catalase family peroxidase [Thauera sp. 2A1]KAI5914043.1 catalase family peroxidase [Thauera sp. 2A1]
MKTITLAPVLAAGLMLTCPPVLASNEITAPQVVEAIEGAFGVTPGARRNHTKGTCAVGEFVGTREAAEYSRSALFSGEPVPVIARFSLSGGNPAAPDTARSGRGMALEFRLPNGQLHHIAMLNTPMFGAATPQTFFDLMQAMRPDPVTRKPDPEKLKAFKASHPDSRAQADYLAANNPPASYASSSYWGIHTFKFVDDKSRVTPVRWQFVPQDGEKRLDDDELKTAGANFLEQALIDRTRRAPVRWDMIVSIGRPGDAEDDPTVPWPAERQRIKAGTLTITSAAPQKGAACEPINFDPMVMADGIEPSDDPVLRFRSPAYAVSFGKRLGGQ